MNKKRDKDIMDVNIRTEPVNPSRDVAFFIDLKYMEDKRNVQANPFF